MAEKWVDKEEERSLSTTLWKRTKEWCMTMIF